MYPNVYCPLCGVIMLDIRYLDDSGREAQRRPWYSEVRGLYQTDAPRSIYLTGLGIIRCRNILCAPPESHRSYFNQGIDYESLEEWIVCGSPEKEPWCFSFHDSCWNILLLRLENKQKKALQYESIIRSLFYQLYCTSCFRGSIFQFGHDYEGAAETHEPRKKVEAVDMGSALYADPCIIEFAKDLEPIASHDSNGKTDIGFDSNDSTFGPALDNSKRQPTLSRFLQDSVDKIRPMEKHDFCIFDKLSPELRSQILSYLSFCDVLSLRLVCRALALFATTSTLSKSYWRSRFLIGQEADFLFPNLIESQNWATLFDRTSRSLKRESLSLINRKRIRKLLEPIAALSELDGVFPSEPYGFAFCPANNSDTSLPLFEKPLLYLQAGSTFSGLLPCGETNDIYYTRCRVLYHRAQFLIPQPQQAQHRIGISTVQLGAQNFISGIKLLGPAESWTSDCSIGYHNPGFVKWIEMPHASSLREIHVAVCSQGLRGIRFGFANSSSSKWVGDTESPGIAFGTLAIHEGPDCQHLLAGLDYYKIVSLGLSKFNEASSNDLIDSLGVQSLLWAPCAPNKSVEIGTLLPLSKSSRVFQPLMNIDFGGPGGLYLGSVRQLTCYMIKCHNSSPLVGIEIFHSDGRSVLCGTRRGSELSFFLDGAKGERIDNVGIYQPKSYNDVNPVDDTKPDRRISLDGLQISTNLGRSVSFASIRNRLKGMPTPLPDLLPNKTITGFIAIRDDLHRIARIGVQSQACEEKPGDSRIEEITDPEYYQVPVEQLQYDEKFTHFILGGWSDRYQTYASLKNIRKIQASRGIQGRSRGPDSISGLRIEYLDHSSPSVVGQWMEEFDDGVEFSPGERIQSFSIWLTPVGISFKCRRLKVCRVTAIVIETSNDRKVKLCLSRDKFLPREMIMNQYQCDPESGEEFTAISWILSLSSDRVRVVASANTHQRPEILVPVHSDPPQDLIQRLYFMRTNSDGSSDPISAIKAFIGDQRIIGIVFVYRSGKIAKIGEVETDTFQSIDLPLDAQVVGLATNVNESSLAGIEFQLQSNGQPMTSKLRLPSGFSHDPVINGSRRRVWCRDDTFIESYKSSMPLYHITKPPKNSTLVGVYFPCQDISDIGVIYQPDGSVEE